MKAYNPSTDYRTITKYMREETPFDMVFSLVVWFLSICVFLVIIPAELGEAFRAIPVGFIVLDWIIPVFALYFLRHSSFSNNPSSGVIRIIGYHLTIAAVCIAMMLEGGRKNILEAEYGGFLSGLFVILSIGVAIVTGVVMSRAHDNAESREAWEVLRDGPLKRERAMLGAQAEKERIEVLSEKLIQVQGSLDGFSKWLKDRIEKLTGRVDESKQDHIRQLLKGDRAECKVILRAYNEYFGEE